MSKSHRFGFTLIEILVVVGIIGILIAILVPAISSAREHARSVQCATYMRQWGIASAVYGADAKGFLPARGEFTGSIQYKSGFGTDPRAAYGGARFTSAWYNALPKYIDSKPYGESFSGTGAVTSTDEFGRQVVDNASTLTGTNSGYSNNWIWYCPSMIFKDKSNSAGTSGAHYAMNGVLVGNGQYNYSSTNGNPFPGRNVVTGTTAAMTLAQTPIHLRLDRINAELNTVPFLLEGHMTAFVNPLGGSLFARWRHNRGSAVPASAADTYNLPGGSGLTGPGRLGTTNIVFLDGHVATYTGNDIAGGSTDGRSATSPLQSDPYTSIPARGVLGRQADTAGAPYQQINPFTITWGPFYP